MILVAIPFKGRPDLLPRAVESVFGQTYRDVRVVVYGDGEKVPVLPKDPRLVIHNSQVNRGPYFALQAMLLASPYEFFAPIGADDWVEPDHLERMLPIVEKSTACTTRKVWWSSPRTAPKVTTVAYEVGLFRTDRLRMMGGYNPAERVGQDSLLVHLLRLTGSVETNTVPTYHRVQRPGSLSTDRRTGNRSPFRNATRARNRKVYGVCQGLAGRGKFDALRIYRESLIPASVKSALEAEVETLRALL